MAVNLDTEQLLHGLCGRDADEILARIFDGDPLGLQGRVMRVLRCNGFLIDPDRCMQHALEELAFLLSGLKPNSDDPEHQRLDSVWIERCVERACDHILAEDIEAQRLEGLGAPVEGHSHRYLSEAFGVTWGQGRSASVAFHGLSLRARLTFFAVCVERMPAEHWIEHIGHSREELRADVWDVFRALGYVSDQEVDQFRQRG